MYSAEESSIHRDGLNARPVRSASFIPHPAKSSIYLTLGLGYSKPRLVHQVVRNAGALRFAGHNEVVSPCIRSPGSVFIPAIIPYFGLTFRRRRVHVVDSAQTSNGIASAASGLTTSNVQTSIANARMLILKPFTPHTGTRTAL